MAELTKRGMYTQWYDTNSNFNASKAAWLKDEVTWADQQFRLCQL